LTQAEQGGSGGIVDRRIGRMTPEEFQADQLAGTAR
jgi:hypothetical protein